MITGSLARRYAKALFEIGNATRNLDKIGADVKSIAEAMKMSTELVVAAVEPGDPPQRAAQGRRRADPAHRRRSR